MSIVVQRNLCGLVGYVDFLCPICAARVAPDVQLVSVSCSKNTANFLNFGKLSKQRSQ